MNSVTRKILAPLSVLLILVITSPVIAEEEKLTLNFTNTDIGAVIDAVGKLTGKNFIIDPRVKGKITVITNEPMGKGEIYQVFQSVLKVHGFAAIPGKNAIKIVPEVNAKQDSIKTVQRSRLEDGDELITQVIPIQHVNATQLVPILRPLIPQRGHLAAYQQSNVLIVSDSASNVARINQIIRRIDQSMDAEVEVIMLEHANADDVVSMIKQLQQGGAKGAKQTYSVIPDARTNSVLLSGDKPDRIRLRALISHIDIPLELGVGDTHVIYLKYAKASELVGVLTGLTQSLTKSTTAGKAPAGAGVQVDSSISGNIQIQADDSNNALVINAPPGVIRSIRSVVQRLDIRRAQVLVEAVIAEVSYDKAAELGVQWAFDGSEGGTQNGPVGVSNFSGFGSPITGLLQDPPQIADGLTLGLGRFTDGALSLAVMVRALAGDADTNILSTPTLVTMDNEEARIVVGQNVPFITGQYTNTGGGTTPINPFQTIERQDIGVTLKITPQINEGDTVFMEIEQSIESLAASTVGADLITNKREITTRVLVDDDQLLVLGGLIEDALRESQQKVPGLGDIPALGWLFKYKKIEKVKKNLMVFIKPTILHNDIDASEHTAQKYTFIRDKQVAMRERGVDFFKDSEAPILPGMDPIPALPPVYQQPGTSALEAPPAALEAP